MELFKKKLSNTKIATSNQRKKELWDIEGVLHNQKFKFDLRPLKNNMKAGSFKTKADKIVFDIENQFIVVDVQELHKYLKDKPLLSTLVTSGAAVSAIKTLNKAILFSGLNIVDICFNKIILFQIPKKILCIFHFFIKTFEELVYFRICFRYTS